MKFLFLIIAFQIISSWGVQNKIDFLSLSYTRHAEDVRQVCDAVQFHFSSIFLNISLNIFLVLVQVRELLSGLGELSQTQIFAKIENVEVMYKYYKCFSLHELTLLSYLIHVSA